MNLKDVLGQVQSDYCYLHYPGQAAVKRKLRRSEVLPFFAELDAALVGIEACHTAHFWGREIAALGHDVRLMPPQFVKPYVKSQKNDAGAALEQPADPQI
jgi:transposase